MAAQKDFDLFLSNIEPSESIIQYISSLQENLREYLENHNYYKTIHNDTFLSGSYAKHTSIRPSKNDEKRDVDIIVVTNYDDSKDSVEVLNELCDVLKESGTYNTATVQHHSVGIEMEKISIDVVPVISDISDKDLYYIGDSEIGNWTNTDPKGHMEWSTTINKKYNKAYKPLVKIFKWWRRTNCPKGIKYPKGITLEKLIADNLGDSFASTEAFFIETMNNIVSNYKESYVNKGLVPIIDDPSTKIKDNNLLDGYPAEEFGSFVNNIQDHVNLLNNEGTDNNTWQKILGSEFPASSNKKSESNALACLSANHRQKMPWSFSRGGAVFIALQVMGKDGKCVDYDNNGEPLNKGCSLRFRAITGVKPPFIIKWQITNTGEEARKAGCLRGNFEDSDDGPTAKKEVTQYTGCHSVQCFVIKNRVCVAKSKDYIINIS